MSSQNTVQSNTKGKAREGLAAASASGPAPQVNPDKQGSHKSGQVSPFDLNKLSTPPSLDQANKRIGNWLNNMEAPSGTPGPSIQDQENVPLSGEACSIGQEEKIKEIAALAKGFLNRQGKPGTIAPANTPQSRDDPGLQVRAKSAGRSAGNRPRMGTQAKTMEDNNLPRPLFSGRKFKPAQGASSSLPDDKKSSTTPDEANFNGSEQPNKSVKRSSSTHARVDSTVWIRKKTHNLQTTTSTSQQSTGTPDSAGSGVKNGSLLKNPSEQGRGLPPTVAKYMMDHAAGKCSAPAQPEPSLSPQPLPGSTVNAHGLAQPPSSLSYQHAEDVPVPESARVSAGECVTEAELVNNSPHASGFQHYGDVECQHSSTCQVMHGARLKSRGNRIIHDLKQLRKDCFSRNPVSRLCAVDFVDPAINEPNRVVANKRQHGSKSRGIFRRSGDKTTDPKPNPFDGRSRGGAVFLPHDEPGCDTSPPPNDCIFSNASSTTVHEASTTSELPAHRRERPKNIFQRCKARWEARWEAASRERARIRREPPVLVWD